MRGKKKKTKRETFTETDSPNFKDADEAGLQKDAGQAEETPPKKKSLLKGFGKKKKETASATDIVQEMASPAGKRVGKKEGFLKKLLNKNKKTEINENSKTQDAAIQQSAPAEKKTGLFKKLFQKKKESDLDGGQEGIETQAMEPAAAEVMEPAVAEAMVLEKEEMQQSIPAESKKGWQKRLGEKPLLLIGLMAAGLLVLGCVGFVTYSIITQTEAYNKNIATLEQRVQSYQSILDDGFNQESAMFMQTLALYQKTLADYAVYREELNVLNESKDYVFVLFDKKKAEDLGINKLEADAQTRLAQIGDVEDVLYSISELKQNICIITKTTENTVDEVIARFNDYDGEPARIKFIFDSLVMPDDLYGCSDYIYTCIDDVQTCIDACIDYYSEIKPIEKKVADLNEALISNTGESGEGLKLKVAYLARQYEQLGVIKSEIEGVNENALYSQVINKVDINVFVLSDEAKALNDISLFITAMDEILTASESMEEEIDNTIKDKELSNSEKQAKIGEVLAQNEVMITTVFETEVPEDFTQLIADYKTALEKRTEALDEYIEYLKDYAVYSSNKSTANGYWGDYDWYWGQVFYYFFLVEDYATAGFYADLGDEAMAKAQEYDSKASGAKSDYQEHYDNFNTLRKEYRQIMGLEEDA
ncbi:MAG: hypothetical protein PHO15_08600 [Eubacteriales bacterium]|nr:hypothetical protein [Eubacteriales bacterium]